MRPYQQLPLYHYRSPSLSTQKTRVISSLHPGCQSPTKTDEILNSCNYCYHACDSCYQEWHCTSHSMPSTPKSDSVPGDTSQKWYLHPPPYPLSSPPSLIIAVQQQMRRTVIAWYSVHRSSVSVILHYEPLTAETVCYIEAIAHMVVVHWRRRQLPMWNPISALYTIAPWRTTSTQRCLANILSLH